MEKKRFNWKLLSFIAPISVLLALMHEVGYFWAIDFPIFTVVELSNVISIMIPYSPLIFVVIITVLSTLSSISKYLDSKFNKIETTHDIHEYILRNTNMTPTSLIWMIASILFAVFSDADFKIKLLFFGISGWNFVVDDYNTEDREDINAVRTIPVIMVITIVFGFSSGKSDLERISTEGANAKLIANDGTVKQVAVLREYSNVVILLEDGAVITWNKAGIQAIIYNIEEPRNSSVFPMKM